MPDVRDALSPATAEGAADALAFALRFQGRKRVHNADETPPIGGAAALVRGHEGRCRDARRLAQTAADARAHLTCS
jgi:hypothetical protein